MYKLFMFFHDALHDAAGLPDASVVDVTRRRLETLSDADLDALTDSVADFVSEIAMERQRRKPEGSR